MYCLPGDGPVVEGHGIFGVELNGLGVVGNSLLMVPQRVVDHSPVVVGLWVSRLQQNGPIVVLEGLLVVL